MILEKLFQGLWVLKYEDASFRGFVRNENGISITSYLLELEETFLLAGSVPEGVLTEWVDGIKKITSGKDVRYFILSGSVYDRPVLSELLKIWPECTVLGTADALYRVEGNVGRAYKSILLRGERELKFCDRTLRFKEKGTQLSAIDVLTGVELGNVLPEDDGQKNGEASDLTVAVVSVPEEFVPELTKEISEGLSESGIRDIRLYDLGCVSRETVLRDLPNADAILFGMSLRDEWPAKAVTDIVTSLKTKDCNGKLASVYWSGSDAQQRRNVLHALLEQLQFDLNAANYYVQGKPDKKMLHAAKEYGFGFGCMVQRIPNPRKPQLIYCPICGETFDASLGVCPICGAGLELCVPAEEEEVLFRRDTNTKYVILGGGIAGVSAAEEIRKRDKIGTIHIILAENHLPINRTLLSKVDSMIGGKPNIFIHEQEWYDEREIQLLPGTVAEEIDVIRKCVRIKTGEEVFYDKLIYALGGEAFIPPFPGKNKDGVLSLRSKASGDEFEARMKTAKNAVVIGGGVIGLEAADKLTRAGVSVTILESAPQICARQIDRESADKLLKAMASLHVECLENVSVEEIEGNTSVSAVRLADGRRFPADLVVISCGIRTSTVLAEKAGIVCGKAVVVNARMETNIKDIWACGDCAEKSGVNWQLWTEAAAQGKTAGANAVGDQRTYSDTIYGLTVEGFGTSLFAIGDAGKNPDIPYKKVIVADEVRNRQETYWFLGDAMQGAVLLHSPKKVPDITMAVNRRARYEEIF